MFKFFPAVYSPDPSVPLFLTWPVQRTAFLSNFTLSISILDFAILMLTPSTLTETCSNKYIYLCIYLFILNVNTDIWNSGWILPLTDKAVEQIEIVQAAVRETIQLVEGFLFEQDNKTWVLPDHSSSLTVHYSFVLSEEQFKHPTSPIKQR